MNPSRDRIAKPAAAGPLRRAAGAAVACIACFVAPIAGCSDPAPAGGRVVDADTFGGLGTYPGAYHYPRVLEAGRNELWVIDKAARVQRIDPASGKSLALWKTPKHDNGKPVGLAIIEDQQGPLLFIADTHQHRVLVQRPPTDAEGSGETIAEFGEFGYDIGQFIYPTDVAVLRDATGAIDRIYVSEYGGNDRIVVYSPDYQPLFTFGTFGGGPGAEFNRPQQIVLDEDRRELVISDVNNHRIGRFTLDGELIAWIGATSPDPGTTPGAFRHPHGLELLGDGTVLVSEFGNSRVQRIDLDTGDCLGIWGEPGRGVGQFAYPWSVAVMNDRVFVLDSGNHRVQSFAKPTDRPEPLTAVSSAGGGA
ncbi:MAG: hypothetical protein AAF747_07855 [Planctomycetota bacterium]